jgi:hypothetical protein
VERTIIFPGEECRRSEWRMQGAVDFARILWRRGEP